MSAPSRVYGGQEEDISGVHPIEAGCGTEPHQNRNGAIYGFSRAYHSGEVLNLDYGR
jgi:hypothetical protein